MNEQSVSRFLIENNYSLTALEFLCENYEKTGSIIDELSQFFEDSANFLMFDDMKSISEISSNSVSESISNDAIRIKDDRIAVLEHEVKVLRDSLEEAKTNMKANTPGPANDSGNDDQETDENEVLSINLLINKYLQKKGYKLSGFAFASETGISKMGDSSLNISGNQIDLVSLWKNYQAKKKENDESIRMKENIEQLNQEVIYLKQKNAELKSKIKIAKGQEKEIIVTKVEKQKDPPSVQLLDAIFSDMMQLVNVVEVSERKRIIPPLETIIKFHPNSETRIQCISLLFNLWDEPNEEQRSAIIQALMESCTNPQNIESEVLSAISLLLASTNPSILCLVSGVVASIAPLCSIQLRCSFLLSILKQLSEHSSPYVRSAAAKDGAKLVLELCNESDANDKLQDLIDLTKCFAFDPDITVQSAALSDFVPAVLQFTKCRNCVGNSFCNYWLKLAFSFGLTGSSLLATLRFKICVTILELSLKFIIPNIPNNDQQLSSESTGPEFITISKSEYEWITTTLVPQLPKFSPMLFVQINIRKEVDEYVSQCCKMVGQQFVSEFITPTFLTSIDKSEGDEKEKYVTLFLSAVSPSCDQETFFTNSRNFLTYATNELRGFKIRDVQEFFAQSFALLSSREPEKHQIIFKLIDELSKSSRAAIRKSAIYIISEILPTLDQNEILNNIIPIINKASTDQDESLKLEVINCIGILARFASDSLILKDVKDLFNKYLQDSLVLRIQTLRVFTVIVSDVDSQFQYEYIFPKISECANETSSWEDVNSKEQALILILHIFYNSTDMPEQAINKYLIPSIKIIEQCDVTSQDPKLIEIKERYHLIEKKPETAFTKMFGSS